MRYLTVAGIMALCSVAVISAQDPAPRFEFITLRRNTTGARSSSFFPTAANRRAMFNMGLESLILRAYAQTPLPGPTVNRPAWLNEERYDVVMGGPFDALTAAQQRPLLRELLADRLKLQAHTETRSEPSFDLVLVRPDRGLGPAFKPSQRECASQASTQLPRVLSPGRNTPFQFPSPEEAMTRCGYASIGGTLYSGGMTMAQLASFLSGPQGRRGVDRTGVEGAYSVTFPNFSPEADFLSRMEQDLGVTLVSSMTDVEVVVIDHIERPSEN